LRAISSHSDDGATIVLVAPFWLKVEGEGKSSGPETAFKRPTAVPATYLLAARRLLPDRPVLIAGISLPPLQSGEDGALAQALYLKKVLQAWYWLNARMVACPGLLRDPAPVPRNLARAVWTSVLGWKLVERLSVRPPGPTNQAGS
jgi:hypothetical protein